jgi:hypothetical protein
MSLGRANQSPGCQDTGSYVITTSTTTVVVDVDVVPASKRGCGLVLRNNQPKPTHAEPYGTPLVEPDAIRLAYIHPAQDILT